MKNFSKELKEILIKLNAPMYVKEIKEILDKAKKLEKTYFGWEELKTELKESAYTHIYDKDLSVFRCIVNIQNSMDNIESGREINDFDERIFIKEGKE